MGCSGSKEDGGVKHPNSRGPQSPPSATEPTQADAMPKALLSAIASSKTDLHTLTTDTSSPSFYGYKGAGRSSASLGESVPPRSGRSEGFTDTSLYSTTSSKRSGGLAGYGGEKLSEQSDEEGIDDDFEDDDERGVAGSTARRGTVGVVGTSEGLGAKRAGLPFLATGRSPGRRSSPGFGAQALPSRQDFSTSNEGEGITRKVSPPLPPSPSSVEDKTPAPSDLKAAEALAEPPSSTVRVLASSGGEGTLSARRGSVEAIVDAKSEGAAVPQSSPGTPRTEEASPTGRAPLASTVTPVRSAARGIGPLALFPEYPMFVLSLAGLGAARCIPDYRAALASGKLLPYDSLNRSTAFVVFISHRWVNQSGGPLPGGSGGVQVSLRQQQQQQQQQDGGEGFGGGVNAPDLGTVKHEILMEGLNSILASLPREVAVFLWIDYSCIDQEDAESKWKGARSVAAYIQLSDAVFTPYAESFYSGSGEERSGGDDKRKSDARSGAAWWGAQSKSDYGASSSRGDRGRRRVPGRGAEDEEIGRAFANPLSEVCGSPWPSSYRSLQDLCSRAWCRLELLLCAALPLRDNGGFRYFVARGDAGRARDRPHFVYGDYQRRRKLAPEALARFADEAWAKSLDPLDGALSNPKDTEAIVHGMAPLRLASRFAAIASSNLSSSSSASFSNAPTATTAAAAAPANTTMTVAVASPTPSSVPHERKRHAVPSYVDAATGVPVSSGSNNSRGRLATDPGIDFSGVGGRARGRTSTATALELKEAVAVAAVAAAPSGGRVVGKSRVGGRGMIPPPIEARPMPNLADEAELSSWRRNDAPPDRLMSPAVKGSRIVASPMRPRTAGAESAVGDATSAARGASSMPGWLWDTVSQYPLAAGDSRTQYVDGSTYVGPLKDGKRHGNGAYFFQDGSQYEGAFKEDKRHGEGTLTLAGGGRYEGGWQNDLQHGQGTFYFADSSCFRGLWKEGKKKNGVFTYSSGGRYIGELHGGRRHGHGSFLYPDGSSYEGQWQDNVKHGEGTAWYASGNRYEGQWRNGKSHGEGTYYYATGARYEGQFDGGKCHGQGTYFYANGNRYVGEWKDDMKWGFGKAIYRNKAHYEGHFFMDKRHGYGRMWYSNAGTYEGEWASGKPHGHGTATHKDGEKYVGTYKAGLYHGEGCYWYTNGAVYEGEYRNGRVHGKGRATFPSGDSYAGEWKEGAMSGHGVYDFKAEGASYEGDFHNGRMHGVGVYRWPHGDVYRGSWEADRRCGRGRYEWTELGLTFEGTFRDDRRTGRGSIIFPDNSRYECQWEDDRAMDSTAEGTRSVHYRANGAECSGDCDVRCKDEGGDELRRLMRRINDQRMMQPVTPTIQAEEEQVPQQRPQQQQQQQQQQRERNTTAHKPSSSVEMAPSSKDQSSTERGIW